MTQHAGNQLGGGGLAVGAGDADDATFIDARGQFHLTNQFVDL